MRKCSFSTAALFPRDSLTSLEMILDAGFDCAEFMPQCFSDVSDDFATRAQAAGVHVGSVHYPLAMFSMLYNAHGGMVADARNFGNSLVNVCESLGASVLVIHPHVPIAEKAFQATLEEPIIENIIALAGACEKHGIRLAMENNPNGPGRNPESLLAYVRTFKGRARIDPMVDTTEACEASVDPAEFIRKVGPVHLHLSDHIGEKKHLPAGEGSIDWAGVKASLASYDGIYVLEPSYRYYLEDAESKLGKALDFARSLAHD